MIKVSDYAKEKAIQLMTEDGFNPAEDYIRVG
jgi:iron-sulfur cluster assembly protein